MSKTIIWTIVIIVIIAAGIWFWTSRNSVNAPTTANVSNTVAPADTATAMQADLNNVQVQDPNFQSIDQDVSSL